MAQSDTTYVISKNYNYTCDCPDTLMTVYVYDTIGVASSNQLEIVTTGLTTYSVTDPAMYIFNGTSQSVFTLPVGTDAIAGIDYLFVNSGTAKVTIENNSGVDLIIIDAGMIINAIWNKITWNTY